MLGGNNCFLWLFSYSWNEGERRILAACLEQVWIWLAMTEDLGCVKQRGGFLVVALKDEDGLEEPWSMVRRSTE